MKNSLLSGAIILAMSSSPALATEDYSASILGMDGNVLVNQGESYRTATRGMKLKEGDRVMIMDGAQLSMSYPDGCHFTFKDGQIIEVGATSVCAMGGTGFVAATTPQYVQAAPGAAEDDDAVGAAGTSGNVSNVAGIVAAGAFIGWLAYLASEDGGIITEQPPVIIPPKPPISQ